MKIGITERGDAGINLAWKNKLVCVDGAILITKNITDQFIEAVITAYDKNKHLIVHCTCTGLGHTIIEPNVPNYKTQLQQLNKLIERGFPKTNCVLRIDPIFPTPKGLNKVKDVMDKATELNLLPCMRVRISVLDEYRHVKERFRTAGFEPLYDGFTAPAEMMNAVVQTLTPFDTVFECCAEPMLTKLNPDKFITTGCVSKTDLNIMGIPLDPNIYLNPQNRNGCACLSCKTELLTERKQCPHKCLYCFWKN
jgi:hypothetical protein